MSNLVKFLLLCALVILSGCDSDASDAEKYTKPTVDAGSDKVYNLPQNTISLSGSAKTYPKNVYSIKETKWTQTSGPVQLAILNSDSLTATLINPTQTGTYTFELYVKDSGGRTNTDSVKVVLTQSAQVATVRSSLGYSDDYELMWKTFAQDTSRYSAVEDKWQQLYQPYLVEADRVNSDEEWQGLVTHMISELDTELFELQINDETTSELNSTTGTVFWVKRNGVGRIGFETIAALSSHELLSLLSAALRDLSDCTDIYLDFSASGDFDEQLLLTLISTLAAHDVRICPTDADSECVEVNANPDAVDVRFVAEGANSHKYAQQVASFLDSQEQGDAQFVYQPSLFLTSKLILK
ncbi:hypothetical protein L1D31_02675 [Vibrio sp. Isolate23]|uniref:PKD domain-containing protein n=1 Tax=Vibrio sp. Isolate23 TaxID=2908533 RepID=UPI001EFD720B|nr:hypothetical protein [Vibrio sp. Isolate23]MCG9681460.1 hypothetical protein [Vibrio sp. Isolate23]